MGARCRPLPSPFRVSSQAAGDDWRAPPSVEEDGGGAVPSGKPSALIAVTSHPVPRFRCESLVSPLGAGSPHLRRRGSRATGGTPRARGRPRWWQALSLWRCLGHRHQKANSRSACRAGTTPGRTRLLLSLLGNVFRLRTGNEGPLGAV